MRFGRVFIILSHGILMMLLTFIWLRQPYIFDFEFGLTKDVIDIEYYLRGAETQNKDKYLNKFLFVNTSNSLEIDDSGVNLESNVITSRNQLKEFLKILKNNQDHYQLIIFDVFIEQLNTKTDSALANVIKKLKQNNKILTTNIVEEYISQTDDIFTKITPNAFGQNLSGPTYYPKSISDAFYKFSYQFKSNSVDIKKQLPILAYECIENTKANKPFLFDMFYTYKNKQGIYQNFYIPRIRLSNDDIIINSEGNNLNNTINLNWYYDAEESILETLKTRPKPIIIIGDLFYGDSHYATSGLIKGPLIIANTIIPLLESENKLHFSYILFLIVVFSLVSYLAFFPSWKNNIQGRFSITWINQIVDFVLDKLHYIILLIATLVGVFFFNHYIFLLFNVTYIYLLENLLNFIKKRTK